MREKQEITDNRVIILEETNRKYEERLNEFSVKFEKFEKSQSEKDNYLKQASSMVPIPQSRVLVNASNSSFSLYSNGSLSAKVVMPEELCEFLEKNLKIDVCSDKGNFFTILAKEINRIEGSDSRETELRSVCASFAMPKKKHIIDSLHQQLRNLEIPFDANRQNYSFIKYDKASLKQQQNPMRAINGVCCVEGVLLCKHYDLHAIYEIVLTPNKSIRYDLATSDGFKKDVSEESFKQHLEAGDGPILLNYAGNYYSTSKVPCNILVDNGAGVFPS